MKKGGSGKHNGREKRLTRTFMSDDDFLRR